MASHCIKATMETVCLWKAYISQLHQPTDVMAGLWFLLHIIFSCQHGNKICPDILQYGEQYGGYTPKSAAEIGYKRFLFRSHAGG